MRVVCAWGEGGRSWGVPILLVRSAACSFGCLLSSVLVMMAVMVMAVVGMVVIFCVFRVLVLARRLLKDVTTVVSTSGRAFGCVKGTAPKPAPRPTPAPPPPRKHLGCKYGLPSISHNDSAYGDQDYWRGRTWGPMNFLVYRGLAHPK